MRLSLPVLVCQFDHPLAVHQMSQLVGWILLYQNCLRLKMIKWAVCARLLLARLCLDVCLLTVS